jgi:coenzyme PQQ precursor peptide PqqA
MELAFERRARNQTLDRFQPFKETTMQWTTPSFTDMRFGFEITMYIATR